jgi:CRISPR-associated protein Csa3
VVANLSGGPREIFLAFTIVCLSQSGKIHRTTKFGDIERSLNENRLPNITIVLEEKQKKILKDIFEFQPAIVN